MNLVANGQNVEFWLDTGAQATVLTYETFCLLKVPIVNVDAILAGADGKRLSVYGGVELEIKSKRNTTNCLAHVVKGARRNLLAVDQITNLDMLILVNSVCEGAFDAFQRFPKLFDELGTMPGSFSIFLKPGTVPLNLYAPRPIP